MVAFTAEPLSMSPQKALEQIGNTLQKQYERWQPRARYKQLLDPTTDDVRKLCVALRKNAKVLLYVLHSGYMAMMHCVVSLFYANRTSMCCSTTMDMGYQSRRRMEKFGCSIR